MTTADGSHIRFATVCALGVVWLSLVLATGCEPWGKPKPEPTEVEEITDFKTLYRENCTACHGVDGKNGPGRPLNNPLYLAVIPRETLQKIIENGRPGTAMPAWARSQGGPLTPKQIAALVNGIEQDWAKPDSFQGATLPPYSADDQNGNATNGKKLFARNCFICHGQPQIGAVTDPAFLSLVTDQVLRTSIIEGRPDLGMPDYRSLNRGHALGNQDIADLVAYMSSLRPIPANEQSAHTVENGTGEAGQMTKGNEGSGNGPGSPQKQQNEGIKGKGSSSQRGVK